MQKSNPENTDSAHASPVQILLNRKQLAERLGVTTRTLIRWDLAGLIPSIRIGNSVRYHLPDVLDWVLKQQNFGKPPNKLR